MALIQFESPFQLLWLVPLVPFLAWWYWKSYADLAPTRGRVALTLRSLALLMLVLALSKPVLLLENSDRTILFLIDVSDSVTADALEESWSEIQSYTKDRESGEKAGVVLFGKHPALVVAPKAGELELTGDLKRKLLHESEEERIQTRVQEIERSELTDETRTELEELRSHLAEITAWRDEIGSDETDLEAACRLARGLIPLESRRRVMIYSDGNTNRGDLMRELGELEREGFTAHTRMLERGSEPEVIAEALFVPAEAQVKAAFRLEFAIAANVETKATVKIYRNKYLISEEKDFPITEGRALLSIDKLRLEEGFHEFEAVVEPETDTVLQNNVARAVVRVAGRPKVLLIERIEREARHLEEALAGEEIEVEVRPESGVPEDLNDLLNYDVIILSDISADRFSPGAMDAVKTYVHDMGGGLVMLGGERSFGLGGYYRTPIEDTLPVKMPIKKNIEKPNLALVLVIDKSGSMGGNKIELAKEAAIASAEVLKGNDRFGVVAFDSREDWITPITDSSESGIITNTIARLVPGGGTNIYPALHAAWQALVDEDAKLKHIILLSDGHTTGGGYDTLVGHIAADAITVSAVGIGEGADQALLEDMASWGGGEAYFTNDFATIPQIFTRETMRASKSMLVEEPFVPTVTAQAPALKGIDPEAIPFLLGYVATQAKETATTAMVSDYGDPVLATWNYGLGRAAAFTSDAKAKWAGDWIGWESYPKFWSQLVRSVMSTGAHKELRTRTRIDVEQGVARVTLDVRDRRGAFRDDVTPEVSILVQDGDPVTLETEHLGPGLYRATFPIEEYGEFYRLLVVQKQGDDVVDIKALGVTESYSPEFRTPLPDEDLLELVAHETGGTFAPADVDAVWKFEGDPARTPKDTWWWWLLAAAFLLPIDIAVRRLGA
ncbi:MAG: VWA domain-containing protein [bacterium]|nr:VWA domain-containing protein [bacterium]